MLTWLLIFLFFPGAALVLFVVIQFLYRGSEEIVRPDRQNNGRPDLKGPNDLLVPENRDTDDH